MLTMIKGSLSRVLIALRAVIIWRLIEVIDNRSPSALLQPIRFKNRYSERIVPALIKNKKASKRLPMVKAILKNKSNF
jgi:hypothetical protein